ncbi:hypothetical protein E5676_scaffold1545G00420 [Cucumis melo var. makuwa]|uniref:Uncharacterized protein n=2 Tax=Cucumis melo TaxID=3656 RepID=A0A5A7UEN9_CUCMM|nr:hypothetical protein E6C27_scaffold135G00420 [Cucumis melo var. makuwa]TYK00839.1 hypothetical protein E5676_scaffold1545G00420 [Cucumis melo var. makuwa]
MATVLHLHSAAIRPENAILRRNSLSVKFSSSPVADLPECQRDLESFRSVAVGPNLFDVRALFVWV